MRNILILIVTFVTGCSIQQTSEQEVINATFMEMVGTVYYNEPLPPPPYRPIHPDTLENEIEEDIEITIELDDENYKVKDSLTLAREWRVRRDSLLEEFDNFDWGKYKQDSIVWHKLLENPKRDKRKIILKVYDSLIAPNQDFINLSHRLTKEGFKKNINLEDSWRQLLIKLIKSDFKSKYLNINKCNFNNIDTYGPLDM